MATILVVAVAVVVVGTALGLVRQNRRRIAALEHELHDVYQAQQILERARDRKDRKHLHLLALAPLAWLARSSHARLAAATGLSAALVGVGFTATDNPTKSPLHPTPPAAAESLENTPVPPHAPIYSYGTPPALQYPSTTTSTTVAAEAPAPPPASATVEAGPAPITDPPPSTVPAPSTTTTTPVAVEVEVPRVCVTPAVTVLDTCVSG